MKQNKTKSGATRVDQEAKGFSKQKRNNQNFPEPMPIKQVNGARPEMNRARSARPPDIVRPSGSGIPRGMGIPGGAFRYGGR